MATEPRTRNVTKRLQEFNERELKNDIKIIAAVTLDQQGYPTIDLSGDSMDRVEFVTLLGAVRILERQILQAMRINEIEDVASQSAEGKTDV